MSATGRNDPCPCGSGRKFKQCCLRARDADDAARMRLRTTEGVLVPALFAYAAGEFGGDFFAEAWEEFRGSIRRWFHPGQAAKLDWAHDREL